MVAVAPLPAGFDKPPIDAASLPAAPPPEPAPPAVPQPSGGAAAGGWGVRAHEFPQGWVDASPAALAAYAAAEEVRKRWAGPPIRHGSELARERAEREAAMEAERQARPDPRQMLAHWHQKHAEAAAEAARLDGLAHEAAALVADLEQRQTAAAAAVEAGDADAAARLIAALAAGDSNPVLAPPQETGGAETAAAAIGATLRVARGAAERLTADLAKARDWEIRTGNAVQRAALAIVVDDACMMAREVLAIDAEQWQRRADLTAAALLISTEQRRLDGRGAVFPGLVSRAMTLADPHLHGLDKLPPAIDWRQHFKALVDNPPAGEGAAGDGDEHPLRAWRHANGVSLAALAGRSGATAATLSRIETDIQFPKPAMLRRLCEIIGLDPQAFLDRLPDRSDDGDASAAA